MVLQLYFSCDVKFKAIHDVVGSISICIANIRTWVIKINIIGNETEVKF